MNWLIYIGGWNLGMMLFMRFGIPLEVESFEDVIPIAVTWTMLWIWICWRFIA